MGLSPPEAEPETRAWFVWGEIPGSRSEGQSGRETGKEEKPLEMCVIEVATVGNRGQCTECLLEHSIQRMRSWRLSTGSHAPLVDGGSRHYLPTLPGCTSVRCDGLPASETVPWQKTFEVDIVT